MSTPTTPEQWIALRENTRQSAILQRTVSQTIELRLCAVLTFLSGLLYAASFLKRRKGGMWICKKDVDGYYHPNVHTTLPIFAVLYAILDVSAVLIVEKTLNHPVDPVPVTLQLLAYQILQVFAWIKIWAVLYALLSSRLRRHTNIGSASQTRKLVSPRIFNTFIFTTITTVLMGQIPLITSLNLSIEKFRNQFSISDLLLQQITSVSTNPPEDLAAQTILNLIVLKDEGAKANRLFLSYLIFLISWMSFNILVFSISTAFLLHALRTQKNVLSSALENRKVLKQIQENEQKQVNVRQSCESWVFCTSEGDSTSRRTHKSFNPWTWKSWIDFAKDESLNGDAFWNRINMLNLPVRASRADLADAFAIGETSIQADHSAINDAALEVHCATTTRYWYSTMGQTIIGLGMFSAYLIMACWLLIESPNSSGKDELIEAFIWSNWTWGGGPGLVLGIVACIVAFSPSPALPQSSKHQALAMSTSARTATTFAQDQEKYEKNRPTINAGLSCSRSELDIIPSSAPRPARRTDNLSISSSVWRSPSTDSCRADNSTQDLARRPSFSSSIFSFQTARHESFYKAVNDEMPWAMTNDSAQEDSQTEWIGGGHFKAIKGLREGI
ncbi:uncharacterized protein PGTG_16995 [Puccinia graminis f. sp. tritici CRL 75-36-700-3]|uniref:Uncharacterized protein n=1 Tax=Puccinia graminis f. sp. tritici (strain CRL 75-36-700-3 / race SCCL) TaxID=418459 RepID=E3L466_PUCGT|nr:uncharacterized protein PGTG_16995 [Puccinia graminis f. sp. tritici CRL 75-36-700-3]EFP91341.1 hypothetical protein PGTG_16995 [Puccinia graminis f. sp. tritici CRL 75-36-700-3]